jgi:1,4-dihydroxy-6-naphthoate synthase
MGDNYGPMIVTRNPSTRDDLRGKTIAVPGTLTTAYLSCRMWLKEFEHVVVPFDEVLDVVEQGSYQGKSIDAGLVIHEGQLTYHTQNLHLHRHKALDYALGWGRGLERDKADTFVGMYVNEWTLDFTDRGRQAVRELLKRGYEAGVITKLVEPEFVDPPTFS